MVSVPPHTATDALAIVRPVGNVSVKLTPASGSGLLVGFVIVNVSELVAFRGMPDGLKDSAIEGGASTFMIADAVWPVPPSVDVTVPVVLFFVPAVVPLTFTENVHEALAAKVAPDKLTDPDPAAAAIVPPPQVPVRPFGVEITRPAGNASLNPTPLSAVVLLLF